MPNGGYPMHYLIQIPGTDLAIHADGATVHLKRAIEARILDTGGTAPQYEDIGTFTNEHINGLLYHLNYWGVDTSGGHMRSTVPLSTGKQFNPNTEPPAACTTTKERE